MPSVRHAHSLAQARRTRTNDLLVPHLSTPTRSIRSDAELMMQDERLAAAQECFRAFLSEGGSIAILHDMDADGITAGVILEQALLRSGRAAVRLVTDSDRSAWSEGNRRRLREIAPSRLFVLDLGSRAEPILERVPTCFIDHHRPDGLGSGDSLISGYDWDPAPNTSWLSWEMSRTISSVSDLDWIAAIGMLSDLGERAPFQFLTQAFSIYSAGALKEATVLVNAVRRAAHSEPEVAARALLMHRTPKDLVSSDCPEVQRMRAARVEVNAAMMEAKKRAPTFAGPVALIRIRSACQIHPLIAQIWRSRLPKYVVIVANEGYRPGRVNFSVRGQQINVLEFLANVRIPDGDGAYGHGHDQASGGSLPVEQWNNFLAALGFPETVRL